MLALGTANPGVKNVIVVPVPLKYVTAVNAASVYVIFPKVLFVALNGKPLIDALAALAVTG